VISMSSLPFASVILYRRYNRVSGMSCSNVHHYAGDLRSIRVEERLLPPVLSALLSIAAIESVEMTRCHIEKSVHQ
jgi:hypothetical protein